MRFPLAVGFLLIFLAAGVSYLHLPGHRESGVFSIEPATPYFHYSNGATRGRVLVVHGLDANKGMMNMLCYALADAGFEVFAIDLPGHGESRAKFDAAHAEETVGRIADMLGSNTILVGHSLGASFLLDYAQNHPVQNMVLFSPGPTPINTVMTQRLLLFSGEFEIPPFRKFVKEVALAAQGNVELHDLAWTGHSGALTKPAVLREVAGWLGGDTSQIHTTKRLVLLAIMLVSSVAAGIVLIFTQAAKGLSEPPAPNRKILFIIYIGAAFAGVSVLRITHITDWLNLFVTDYLIGFLFLTGVVLFLITVRARVPAKGLLIGGAAAAYVIAVPGMLVISELVQITLSGGRVWRFPAILVLGLPLCLADELLIRTGPSPVREGLRFLLIRALLAAILVSETLIWSRDYMFLLLIMYLVVAFWLLIWLGAGLVRRRTQSPFAAALFASILQAWFFAALFVIT